MKKIYMYLLFIAGINLSANAQVLVKDINSGGGSSSPSLLRNVNGILYFTADDYDHGRELWKSDGTPAGTMLVKDIDPDGNGFSTLFPDKFAHINNTLFFTAYDEDFGTELWKSDGTASGTMRVKDIGPGNKSGIGATKELVAMNGIIYFIADDWTNQRELWRSDGTEAGTYMVKNIAPIFHSYPEYLTVVNNTLYFSANDESKGAELWKSDGTAAGTVMVKNISSSGGSSPAFLLDVNGTLYFNAYTPANGRELWKSDGTDAGTVLVKDINPGSANSIDYTNVNNFININGTLFFSANDGVNGIELWKTDGTEAGTVMVKDIRPGKDGGLNLSNIRTFVEMNGMLYFMANDGVNGPELWKSDGTEAGTVMVKDIRPGSTGSDPGEFVKLNNMLYFRAHNGTNYIRLWKSDGTEAGTVMIDSKLTSNPRHLTVMDNKIFFQASGNEGIELWKYDPAATNIEEAVNNRNTSFITVYPNPAKDQFYIKTNKKLSVAINDVSGRQVWNGMVTNGQPVDISDLAKGIYIVSAAGTAEKFKLIKE